MNRDTTIEDASHATGPVNLIIKAVPFRLSTGGLQVSVPATSSGHAALVSGCPLPSESLDEAARRILRTSLNSDEQYMEQLYTFGQTEPGCREVIVSYLALTQAAPGLGHDVQGWTLVRDANVGTELDRIVLRYALTRLRAKLGYSNVAFHMLPPTFTLSELQAAYEQVLDHPLDKRNFRRRMTASRTLEQLSAMQRDVSHRPAALYQFAARDDQAAYLTPSWVSGTSPESTSTTPEPGPSDSSGSRPQDKDDEQP